MSEKVEGHRNGVQNRGHRHDGSGKVESHSGVRFHHPRQQHSPSVGGSTSSSSTGSTKEGRLIPSRVFVGNIPTNLVERDLGMLFTRFGKIRDVKIIPDHTRSKSYGFVTFFSEIDARRAIQASVQHDAVMWGDRKLNVAPAIKRNNNNSGSTDGFYPPARSANGGGTTYYTNPLHVSSPALFHTPTPNEIQQPVVETVVDASGNNTLYQTALFCRMPHQYAMSQCHQYSSTTSGHYFVTPSFQPFVQGANQGPHFAGNYASAYAGQDNFRPTVAAMTTLPLQQGHGMDSLNVSRDGHNSGSSSSSSSSSSTITDGLSDTEGGEGCSSQDKKNDGQETSGEQEETDEPHPSSAYPLQAAMICCAHHSCMMSPISPVAHLPGQARSCLSLHPTTPGAVPACFPPSSPLIAYGSPMTVYGSPSPRRNHPPSARLQRWNSLDGGIQHQHMGGLWPGNETAWGRPSLGDAYGSETGLHHYSNRQPVRPSFPCQSHGMFSPFCRSFDLNVWGQPLNHQYQGYMDSSDPSSLASSSQSLNQLNLNETPIDLGHQPQQSNKK